MAQISLWFRDLPFIDNMPFICIIENDYQIRVWELMKKLFVPVLCIALSLAFTGCSDGRASSRNTIQTTGVREVLQSGISSQSSETTSETTTSVTIAPPDPESFGGIDDRFKGTEGIDIDLTKGSANVVYAQVYSMMYAPEEYIGKMVKMQGQFTFYKDEATGKYYFACFISDAAACCTQGIEFIPAKKTKYPDDFPKVGTEISVTGEFYTYKEGDDTFAALKDAQFKTV